MLLIVVAESLADAFGGTFPILRTDFSAGFFGTLFQGPIGYRRQSQLQILQEILLQILLFHDRMTQKVITLLKLIALGALFRFQSGTPLSCIVHKRLLLFNFLIQLSTPLCPGLVLRPVQELLYRPDPRLRYLHLFLRLRIGPVLSACLVTEVGNAVFR